MKQNSTFSIPLIVSFIFCMAIFTSCEEDHLAVETDLPEAAGEAAVLDAPVSNGIFTIINRNSGKALDVYDFSTSNGGNIAQWAPTGSANQKWILTENSEGYYSIVSVHSGKALDVYQSGTADGANVVQWSNWGGTNQQWEFVGVGDGYYRIVNRNSGKVLDVEQSSTSDGANVHQWSYWGGTNQQWSLNALATGSGNGQLSWVFTSSGIPQDVSDRISAAMNAAVIRYNAGNNWPSRTLTVEYNTGVATADANLNGHIRFGANASYQAERTALHEIAHTYGVGLSSGWSANIVNGVFVGTNTDNLIKSYDDPNAVINTGGGHFWPYGLNYDNEMSETNAQRHVQIVRAMVQDGI